MKKLTIIFILLFIGAALFAEPKVPKKYKGENIYSYISNDYSSCYTIQAMDIKTPNFKYVLEFKKSFLHINKQIKLLLLFENEKQLDNFIRDINLADIENEFIKIRSLMIKNDILPNQTTKDFNKETFDFSNQPPSIIYQADGSKLK